MNFSEALHAVKNGNFIAREGWNGKSMFVFLVKGSIITIAADRPLGKAMPELVGTDTEYRSHLDMKTAQGDVVPWVASQTDILADDWLVVI